MGGILTRNELKIGIAPHLVLPQMPEFSTPCAFGSNIRTYPPDEIAARLHHGLTQIYGFPNGNGRHALECRSID